VVGYFGGTVLLWDTAARPELPIFTGHTESLSSVSFSADDRTVLTSSPGDHTARLWDATSGQEVRQFHSPNDSSVNSAAFSPDGKYLLTGDGHGDKAAHTWDLRTGTMLQTFQHDGNVNQAVYSPDGQTVLTASLDKTARLWNAATGQLLHTLHGDMVYSVAYAPDGKTVLTGGRDMIGHLWDAQTGTEIRRFVGHTQSIEHILYSPDGQWVLTGSDDGTARLWDLQTGAQLGVFAAHGNHAAFSPDGTRILTSGGDQVARLWDITGAPTSPGWGRELRSLAGHTGGVEAVAFSHDGKLILTGSDDKTARLWHVDYHDTIRDLCRRLIRDLTEDERIEYNISDTTPTCPGP
jgi:WD40 repeat protein